MWFLWLTVTGIIPTRVGTRAVRNKRYCRWQDHPHACGDKIDEMGELEIEVGSSPRVWGQDFEKIITIPIHRIIPTRVGTSSAVVIHAVATTGSSPRVWGQAIVRGQRTQAIRIIPTRVGTSFFAVLKYPSSRDHPHACGDKGTYTNNPRCL